VPHFSAEANRFRQTGGTVVASIAAAIMSLAME
jgi:hypothetical protein